MIFDREKQTNPRLLLSSLLAARRFARINSAKAGKRPWIPLVLSWRKNRRVATRMPIVRVTSPTHVDSHNNLQFHFTSYFAREQRAAGSSVWREPIRISTSRLIQNHSNHHFSRDGGSSSTVMNNRGLRSKADRFETASKTSLTISGGWRRRPEAAFAEPVRVIRRRKPAMLLLRPVTRTLSASDARIQIAASEQKTHQLPSASRPNFHDDHRSQIYLGTRTNTSYRTLTDERRTNVTTRFSQQEELIWRRVSRERFADFERGRQSNVDSGDNAQYSRASARQTPGDPLFSGAGSGAAKSLKDFDSSMIDRLTEDIIRRVEKKARIERERRGIR